MNISSIRWFYFFVAHMMHFCSVPLVAMESTPESGLNSSNPIVYAIEEKLPFDQFKAVVCTHREQVNEEDDDGLTPLVVASIDGTSKHVKYLIENDANVDYQESVFGSTALMQAVEIANFDVIKVLLESDASTKLVDFDGKNYKKYADDEQLGTWPIRYGTVNFVKRIKKIRKMKKRRMRANRTPLCVA